MPLQKFVERIILASRWVLVLFYLGLAVALVCYAIAFGHKLFKMTSLIGGDEEDMLLAVLNLIDAALVAGLVVMVMLSSYDNFVARLNDTGGENTQAAWRLDPGSLKIKVASAIVAISSIHLLQVFLHTENYSDSAVLWRVVIHITFIVSALMLGVLDRIGAKH